MDITWQGLQLLLLVGLVVTVPTVFVLWMMRRQLRAMRSPEIEAEYAQVGFHVAISWKHGAPIVTGLDHGTPFELALQPGAGSTPARTILGVPGAAGEGFTISREASRDLSGHDFVESMFSDVKTQESVRALFRLGFDTIELRGEKLRAIRHFQASLLPLYALRTAIGQLTVLRAAPRVRGSGRKERPGAGWAH